MYTMAAGTKPAWKSVGRSSFKTCLGGVVKRYQEGAFGLTHALTKFRRLDSGSVAWKSACKYHR